MRLDIIVKLAFKNLWSHRLRAVLTIAGVTIGIASIIFLVSLGYGLEQLVTSQVTNFDAFTTIDVPSANISTFKIDDEALEKIRDFENVTKVAPVTNIAGRIRKTESSSTAETIIVGAGNDYWKIAGISSDSAGNMPRDNTEVAVNKAALTLIGEDENEAIGKTITVDVIVPSDLKKSEEEGISINTDIPLKISGVLEDNKSPIIYTSIGFLSSNGVEKYSSIKLKVDDKDSVSGIRKQLENTGFSTEYVGDTVDQISQVFSLFRAVLSFFGLIALVVAALGTFNTLTISLLERIREIGLFKALGMKKKDIRRLFLAESMIIGVLGGLFGLILGYLLGCGINCILTALANRAEAETIKLFVTPWFFTITVGLFSLMVSFLTGWYPSRRAVKIGPLDALRYE